MHATGADISATGIAAAKEYAAHYINQLEDSKSREELNQKAVYKVVDFFGFQAEELGAKGGFKVIYDLT
jgi:hypothetical protein